MKEHVTFSCGHAADVSLSGTPQERKVKVEWLEACGMCPDCYKKLKERVKQREAKNSTGTTSGGDAD